MPQLLTSLFLATAEVVIKSNISFISLLLITMKEEGVSHIFVETQWNSHIPEKYAMNTREIKLNKVSIDYLTSDETNPNIEEFEHQA